MVCLTAEWKEKHQQKATPEQLARFNEIEAAKNKIGLKLTSEWLK